jgi:glycerate-2-kinase
VEIQDIKNAFQPAIDGMKAEIEKAVKAVDEKREADAKQINEDLAKKGASLIEISAKIDEVNAAATRMKGGIEAEAHRDWTPVDYFKSDVKQIIAENFDKIKAETPFMATKTVGPMIMADNLTGTSQVSYVPNSQMRSIYTCTTCFRSYLPQPVT